MEHYNRFRWLRDARSNRGLSSIYRDKAVASMSLYSPCHKESDITLYKLIIGLPRNIDWQPSTLLYQQCGFPTFPDTLVFSCSSFLLMYHWKTGSVMHEITTQAKRTPKFTPTAINTFNNKKLEMVYRSRTRILRPKDNAPRRPRNVIEWRRVSIVVYAR